MRCMVRNWNDWLLVLLAMLDTSIFTLVLYLDYAPHPHTLPHKRL